MKKKVLCKSSKTVKKATPKPRRLKKVTKSKESWVPPYAQKYVSAQKTSSNFGGSSVEQMAPISAIMEVAAIQSNIVFPKEPLPKQIECAVCVENLPCSQMKLHIVC